MTHTKSQVVGTQQYESSICRIQKETLRQWGTPRPPPPPKLCHVVDSSGPNISLPFAQGHVHIFVLVLTEIDHYWNYAILPGGNKGH